MGIFGMFPVKYAYHGFIQDIFVYRIKVRVKLVMIYNLDIFNFNFSLCIFKFSTGNIKLNFNNDTFRPVLII